MADNRPLDDSTLLSSLWSELRSTATYSSSTLVHQRERATRYYYAEKWGPILSVKPGRSGIVTTEVRDTVEWMLPELMKMFTAGEELFEYEASDDSQVDFTQDATDYINWVWNKDNDGYSNLYSWFKEALLHKNGFIKAWWEEKEENRTESYQGLNDLELAQVMEGGGDVEVIAASSEMTAAVDPLTGEQIGVASHDVKLNRRALVGRIQIEPVMPEDFYIDRRATCMKDAIFTAQRAFPTKPELIEMGVPEDVVERLPAYMQDHTWNTETQARLDYDQSRQETASVSHTSTEKVLTYDAYYRVDDDGDGRASLLRVLFTENEILLREEADDIPYFTVTPIPIPGKFFGLSEADITYDLQENHSTVMRAIFDNLYQTINQRHEVPESVQGDHTLDDLAHNVPGGWVRTSGEGGIKPLPVLPVWQTAFPVMEKLQQMNETRTGVTRNSQGVNADVLNETATKTEAVYTSGQQRVELIGQIFARTGVKDLGEYLLKLAVKHGKPKIIPNPRFNERLLDQSTGQPQINPTTGEPLTEQFIEVDPSRWPESMGVKVKTGLGTGTQRQRVAQLTNVFQAQMTLRGSGDPELAAIATAQDIYETLSTLTEVSGIRQGGEFFTDPTQAQMMNAEAQQQAAAEQAAQMQQMMQMQAAMQAELEQMRIWTKAQADMAEAEHQNVLDIRLQNVKDHNKMAQQEADNEDKAELEGFKAGTGG